MKATDYFDKWFEKLITSATEGNDNEVIADIITDFGKELKEMAEQRKVHFDKAYASLFKEQSKKYNKFCRLVNEHAGVNYLKEDGLKKYWIAKNPLLKELIS